jgi:hypothetical protein
MKFINELNLVSVTPTSKVNGEFTVYTIVVYVLTPLYDSDKFTITFPSEVTLPSSPVCAISSGLISVSCAPKVGQKMTATLVFTGG